MHLAAKKENDVGLYSLKSPKHAGNGMMSGLRNIAAGVGAGAATLVGAPAVLAKEKGVKGFVTGLGIGIVGGTAAVAGGVGTGVVQMARGIANTPEAIKEGRDPEGKVWDPYAREWVAYDLEAEAADVLPVSDEDFLRRLAAAEKDKFREMQEKHLGHALPEEMDAEAFLKFLHDDGTTDAGGQQAGHGKPADAAAYGVKETELYDVLGVAPDATPAQIKKAYYKKAQELHPDKNPDDPTAKERFQRVGEAYVILSDEKLRANYDKHGKDGVGDAPQMDSAALYAMIFGSEKFERYIGELQMATMTRGRQQQVPEVLASFRQTKREVQCAKELVAMVADFPPGKEAEFRTKVEAEAKELAATPFGATLLYTIGYIYLEQAELRLKTSEGGKPLRRFKVSGHDLAKKYAVANAALRANTAAQRQGARADGSPNLPNTNEAEEELTGLMVEVLWRTTVLDIESTLRHVCWRFCEDRGVDKDTRNHRAKTLYILGTTFIAVSGEDPEAGVEDFKRLMAQQAAVSPPGSARDRRRSPAGAPTEQP